MGKKAVKAELNQIHQTNRIVKSSEIEKERKGVEALQMANLDPKRPKDRCSETR